MCCCYHLLLLYTGTEKYDILYTFSVPLLNSENQSSLKLMSKKLMLADYFKTAGMTMSGGASLAQDNYPVLSTNLLSDVIVIRQTDTEY